jgi:hypothetical protein
VATATFTDTILGPNEVGRQGVDVRARTIDIQPGDTATNTWRAVQTNQSGIFSMTMIVGKTVNVVIYDLGLDAQLTVPAGTFGLEVFAPA